MTCEGCSDSKMDGTRFPGGTDDPCNSSGEGEFCNGSFWYYNPSLPGADTATYGSCPALFIRRGEACGVNQWNKILLDGPRSRVDGALASDVINVVGSYILMPLVASSDSLSEWDNGSSQFTAACAKCVIVDMNYSTESVIVPSVLPANPTPEEWYVVITAFVNGVVHSDVVRHGMFHDGVQSITHSDNGSVTICLEEGDTLDFRIISNATNVFTIALQNAGGVNNKFSIIEVL